jgi:hypothetical protein
MTYMIQVCNICIEPEYFVKILDAMKSSILQGYPAHKKLPHPTARYPCKT